uniref:Ysc84 actin-binding domain-containing protein n=1 Tax=Odontella aurita TaxID=265563 RepID=A0A6U6CC08_9STRA|mmetsp:Transcript_12321/g.36215  ORF Transcript_12321/g.36215 Transcript_12321/m.36215 type:complete len:270 (+) Transcript_12321:1549-2358(+)
MIRHSRPYSMIWNANHVLDCALDPKTNGVPRDLFAQCAGIVLISVVEVGFIFSGNVGTGVIVARNEDGTWSAPSACGLGGIGFGLLFGAEAKDILIIIDDYNLNTFAAGGQIKLGGEMGLTIGPIGREAEGQINVSSKGVGTSFAYSFSRGLFGGIGLEGAILGARAKENERFYGKAVEARKILTEKGSVEIPAGSGVEDLHKKLDLLEAGKTKELTETCLQKKESMREEADKKAEGVKEEQDDVIHVNAKEEVDKEKVAEEKKKGEDV